ncbi:TonB-dependent receptor, partial [Vibrio xuii]
EVAVFYSDYKNFIERTTTGQFMNPANPAIVQYENIAKATIKGIELSNQLSWDSFMPVSGFSSRLAAAYTEGEDGNNNPLNSVNPWNVMAGINYDSDHNWGTSLNLNYTAAKRRSDINGDDILPLSSAMVVDMTAYYKPLKDLTLRAGLFNVA